MCIIVALGLAANATMSWLRTRHQASLNAETHLFDHVGPDGTSLSVSAGDVRFFGSCNCWDTKPGVLISYRLPDRSTGVTPSLRDEGGGDVHINQSWNIGPSFMSAEVSDRVAVVKLHRSDGREDVEAAAGGWVVFGGVNPGWTTLEAFDSNGALVTSCASAVQNTSGCQ